MSFARAADELCVTPTAVSHHIKSLEDFLQVKLFDRRNGRLTLTIAAARSLEALTEGFDRLESAFAPLNRRQARQTVVVGSSASLTALWLMPKLKSFVEQQQDIDVNIVTAGTQTDFVNPEMDIAISTFVELPNWRVETLMEYEVVPVCAPSLIKSGRLTGRAALATLPLLHDDKAIDAFPTWQRYFDEMGLSGAEATRGLRFNQSSLAVEAAINGYGILLGRSCLVAEAVRRGELVVIDEPYPTRFSYYIAHKMGVRAKAVGIFLDWLRKEARQEEALITEMQQPFETAAE